MGNGYSIRECRGHWHVTVNGEDVGPSYPSRETAYAGIGELLRSANATAPVNDTLRRDVDETDAGAVPGCSTECAKLREENADLRREIDCHKQAREVNAEIALAELTRANGMAVQLASLRADAEAVRAVEEWRGTIGHGVASEIRKGWQAWREGKTIAVAPDLVSLGRALTARQQEEGQTDNG